MTRNDLITRCVLGALLGGVIVIAFAPALPIGFLTIAIVGLLVAVFGSLSRLIFAQILLLGPLTILLSLSVLIPGVRYNALVLAVLTFTVMIVGSLILHRFAAGRLQVIPAHKPLEFVAVSLSLVVVAGWRFFMPADGLHALNLMYSSEDNAGIIGNLARVLRFGFDYESTQSLGEWSNTLYNVGAALSAGLGPQTESYLLAPLTQWNFIILTFGMVPLTVLLAFTMTKTKFGKGQTQVLFFAVSAATALLIWPFALFGHLSVILALCLLIPVVPLISNIELTQRLGFYAFAWVALSAYLAANAWFPLIPLSLGLLAIAYWFQRNAPHQRFTIAVLVTVVIGLAVRGWNIVSESSIRSLAVSPGATRELTALLTILWLTALIVIAISLSRKPAAKSQPVLSVLAVFALSAVCIWLFGALLNNGEGGYGATKFLMVAICATTPFLLIALAKKIRGKSLLAIVIFGTASVFLIVTAQKEVGALIKAPLIQASPVVTKIDTAPVIQSIIRAIEEEPDVIYCATPTAQPDLGDSLLGYMCSRWSASLLGQDDANAYAWRYALIGTRPSEIIEQPIEAARESDVILIQVGDPKPGTEAWWEGYIPKTWTRALSP